MPLAVACRADLLHRAARATACALVAASLVAVPADADEDFSAVARRIAEARAALGAPGISVALVREGRLAWSGADGLADVENGVPARGTTVYRVASISKPIAAVAILQLVEAGKVSLTDPIWQFVPALPRHGDNVITIRHILTHTSGIRHYHYEQGEKESTVPFKTFAETLKIYGTYDEPLLFQPGTKYTYSTYAYNLLAGVAEAASGLTYDAYLRERVFGPAAMASSRLDTSLEIVPNRARQYRKAERAGTPMGVTNAPYVDLSFKWAGGGVISTAEDLARFHIALDEGRLLKPLTLAQAYTPETLDDGTTTAYGFGWQVAPDAKGRRWIAHGGGATGGSAYLLRDPERRTAVAILCNVEKAGDLRSLALGIVDLLGW